MTGILIYLILKLQIKSYGRITYAYTSTLRVGTSCHFAFGKTSISIIRYAPGFFKRMKSQRVTDRKCWLERVNTRGQFGHNAKNARSVN